MNIPGFSVRRAYLIARRDFLGYVRTWGFWLTTFGPFIGLFLLMLAPTLMSKSEPTRYSTIFDETGVHGAAIIKQVAWENDRAIESKLITYVNLSLKMENRGQFNKILKDQGVDEALAYIQDSNPLFGRKFSIPENKLKFAEPPADNIDDIKSYILGEEMLEIEGQKFKLYGALHIYEKEGKTVADYWTTSVISNDVVNLTDRYFSAIASDAYLETGGLTRKALRTVERRALNVGTFSPAKTLSETGSQAITGEDSLPLMVAAMLALLLWLTIFTGAYMLLVSMVEEKINKVLEMLLASTRFSEIFVGKLVGVAALTLTSLAPWLIMGTIGILYASQLTDSAAIEGIRAVVDQKMVIFLPIFLVLGFVFYGSIFIALGSLAESMQDASTLMTPMMLLMTACILVVPLGINTPDAPILMAAQWFPFSAPFAAIIRLPSDPPLWETLSSVLSLIVSTMVIIWASSRMFQHGVLTGGGVTSVKDWFSRTILRRKPSK